MASSNGGKRGRPVTLSPEEKLKRDRERWRRKKARKRKETQDAKWQRQTNSGYFLDLSVVHFNRLIETLVASGFLAEEDVQSKARIDEAVDDLFSVSSFNHRHVPGVVGASKAWGRQKWDSENKGHARPG
jgi:hypothetical protein